MARPVSVLLGLISALSLSARSVADGPFPGRIPGIDIGLELPDNFEPSGALWHPGIERLLVVHDNGAIAAMGLDGGDVEIWGCPGDLEAITMVDPESEIVFVGIERPDGIKAFDLEEDEEVGSWDLTEWMRGPENLGLEALTFVPDESLPTFPLYNGGGGSRYGSPGFFYAGLENDGRIYVFDLALSRDDVVSHVATITPVRGRVGMSGLYFQEASGLIYALYNSVDRVVVMTTGGDPIAEWQMPTGYLEGITIHPTCGDDDDEEGYLFLAEDTGPVWRFDFFKADPDDDCDRVPDCRDHCPGTRPNIRVDRYGCPFWPPPGQSDFEGVIRR